MSDQSLYIILSIIGVGIIGASSIIAFLLKGIFDTNKNIEIQLATLIKEVTFSSTRIEKLEAEVEKLREFRHEVINALNGIPEMKKHFYEKIY